MKIDSQSRPALEHLLLNLSVTDESGTMEDELMLNFAVAPKTSYIERGEAITLALGVPNDLIELGTYRCTEIEVQETTFAVRAYVTDNTTALRTHRQKSWEATLGVIVSELAKKSGLIACVGFDLASKKVKAAQSETDLSFLHRLAKDNNGILKLAPGKIILVGEESTDIGMATVKGGIISWNLKKVQDVTGVKAHFWDREKKALCSVLAGVEGHTVQVHGTFADAVKALEKAERKFKNLQQNKETLSFTVASDKELNTARLCCGLKVTLPTLPEIAQGTWFVKRVEHRLGTDQGLHAELECVRHGAATSSSERPLSGRIQP